MEERFAEACRDRCLKLTQPIARLEPVVVSVENVDQRDWPIEALCQRLETTSSSSFTGNIVQLKQPATVAGTGERRAGRANTISPNRTFESIGANLMRLRAICDMTLSAHEDCPTVGMLRPCSGQAQWLASESYRFTPHVRTTEYVDAYGNLCQRFVVPAGSMRIRVEVQVETEDEICVAHGAPATPISEMPDAALQYLLQSRYCPSDMMNDRALQIVGNAGPGYDQVEAIRSWIHQNIEYRYGASSTSTDALDTLDCGAGVCRDYAHVGIALCRALRIPARMVVGYLFRLDPMDLHAWFEAFVGGRWYTFDATQAAPRGGRIVVAYGRDAADVAFLSNYGALQTEQINVQVELFDFTADKA